MKKVTLIIFLLFALLTPALGQIHLRGAGKNRTAGGGGGPTVVATDNFNRADSGSLGANWTALDGGIDIASNAATTTTNSFNVSYWSGNAFNNDQYSKIRIATSPLTPNAIIEITCRVSGTSGNYNFYAVWQNSGQWGMYKQVGATSTDLIAPTNLTFSTNDIIEIRAVGTTISFYLNGTFVQSATDASLSSGSAGFNIFASNDEDPLAEDWEGGNT
jgi:hypothetical protein